VVKNHWTITKLRLLFVPRRYTIFWRLAVACAMIYVRVFLLWTARRQLSCVFARFAIAVCNAVARYANGTRRSQWRTNQLTSGLSASLIWQYLCPRATCIQLSAGTPAASRPFCMQLVTGVKCTEVVGFFWLYYTSCRRFGPDKTSLSSLEVYWRSRSNISTWFLHFCLSCAAQTYSLQSLMCWPILFIRSSNTTMDDIGI